MIANIVVGTQTTAADRGSPADFFIRHRKLGETESAVSCAINRLKNYESEERKGRFLERFLGCWKTCTRTGLKSGNIKEADAFLIGRDSLKVCNTA